MPEQTKRPDVLIEHWLPVAELGVESAQRDNSAAIHPPQNRLHVWWARRPPTTCRAAILAATLPPGTDHAWFIKTLGILGDPVSTYQRILDAKQTGAKLGANPYGYPPAYKYTPDPATLDDIHQRIAEHWGRENLRFLDPMAGGGSIPFEAMRYGFETWANELNPVASVILKATLGYPAKFGPELADDIRKWAGRVHDRARAELERLYPVAPGEQVFAYIWAHTAKCPGCGLNVPLSPNWWLERAERRIAARPVVHGDTVQFQIVENPEAEGFDPDEGTQAGGVGACLGCGNPIPGESIKAQAQAGHLGYHLVALVVNAGQGREFRPSTDRDLRAVAEAEKDLADHWAEYTALGMIPDEKRFVGPADRSANYGMVFWHQAFTPRQLLCHVVHAKAICEVGQQVRQESEPERWRAVMTYLSLILDKCADYNGRMTRWHGSRGVLAGTFDRHDFAFKWSFGEWNPFVPGLGHEWAIKQVVEAYSELCKFASPYRSFAASHQAPDINVVQGNAATLHAGPDGSMDVIVVDPPYYDNVMYAECSDFFYVWEKRVLGDVFPELFGAALTDKQQEAVANVALFRGQKGARELAARDYEDKMRAAFRRMHGLLRDDGVMVVMFTHKQTEAWDALATALIQGGWEITASWPVHTESQHSLHQAKKNAASSTILLVCRKRQGENSGGWWTQVKGEIVAHVKERVTEFEGLGIRGVDLMLSAFGPALQVICQHWPVKLPSGETITPEYALDLARDVVRSHRWLQLVGESPVDVDAPTQFVIYAWDFYKAEQIRFDEARKLYMGLGVDLEELKRRKLVEKSGEYVALLGPEQRVRKSGFDPDAKQYDSVIDGLHAALWWHKEGGLGAVKAFLGRTRLHEDSQFLAGLQAYLKALPAVREEFRALREIADGLMHGRIDVPPEREEQMRMEW